MIALQNGEVDICADPATIELGTVEDDPNLDLSAMMEAPLLILRSIRKNRRQTMKISEKQWHTELTLTALSL